MSKRMSKIKYKSCNSSKGAIKKTSRKDLTCFYIISSFLCCGFFKSPVHFPFMCLFFSISKFAIQSL